MRVFITGGTGFIGSHIVRELVSCGYELCVLKRNTSNISKYNLSGYGLKWINIDDSEWTLKVVNFAPEIIIHAAWQGVSAREREDINIQKENINIVNNLLKIAGICKCKKFIGLGSQAEYGNINENVTEKFITNPVSEYGRTKIKALNTVSSFCDSNKIDWYWIRIFSVYGYDQPATWFISGLINSIKDSSVRELKMTKGEQVYSYLNVEDLAYAVNLILKTENHSGIYNVTSNKDISIKELAIIIKNKIDPYFKLKFGALPYRDNQSMRIAGNPQKFISTFGSFERTCIEQDIDKIINYKINNEGF